MFCARQGGVSKDARVAAAARPFGLRRAFLYQEIRRLAIPRSQSRALLSILTLLQCLLSNSVWAQDIASWMRVRPSMLAQLAPRSVASSATASGSSSTGAVTDSRGPAFKIAAGAGMLAAGVVGAALGRKGAVECNGRDESLPAAIWAGSVVAATGFTLTLAGTIAHRRRKAARALDPGPMVLTALGTALASSLVILFAAAPRLLECGRGASS